MACQKIKKVSFFQLTQEIKDLLAASNLTGKSEPNDPESGCSVDPDSGKPVDPDSGKPVDPDPEPVSKESDPNSNILDQELIPEASSSS